MQSQVLPSFEIVELKSSDLIKLKSFTDLAIGHGYYSVAELETIFNKSQAKDAANKVRMCSFLLKSEGKILGVRFTYPPGNWDHGKGSGANKGLSQDKWPFPIERTAYFQSLFLDDSLRGQGLGLKLSQASLTVLREISALGVVCHSWKESPDNSSSRYLEKLGFKPIAEHPRYWKDVNYECTRCGKPPCQCTAVEMYLRLDGK